MTDEPDDTIRKYGLVIVPITAARVVDAFERSGLGTVTFPEPIKRVGDGTLVTVQLPADVPTSRFVRRRNLVFDYLELSKVQVFVESHDDRRLAIWVHDGDAVDL